MTDFAPEHMRFHAHHHGVPLADLVELYWPRLPGVTGWSITGMMESQKGSLAQLQARLAKTAGVSVVILDGPEGAELTISENEDAGTWEVEITRNYKTITEAWLATLVGILREAPGFPGLRAAAVEREPTSMTSFVPQPPLAGANHGVLVTDAEVAAAYDDPGTFWKMWDVEPVGAWKLCTRALAEIDEDRWLAYTFESTMELVRAARPHLTEYATPYWEPEMAPWWEFGDLLDEKAGHPALAPGDYDDATQTYEMIGFITTTPLEKGGDEPRHVLVREIYDLREMVESKRDPAGRPVDAVRIVFPEEWMARQERRPLLDAGARVFHGSTEITE